MIANFPVWGKAKPKYDAVFANNTWEQIIDACRSGDVPDTWLIGNHKSMTIGGTSYLIDIIGKNHDTYTAGGTVPLTFQMHDCYGTRYAMNNYNTNSGGYSGSAMHRTHLPAIKALMPVEVRNAIKPVNKNAGIGGGASSGVETVSCDLFLLAEVEVFATVNKSFPGEGTQYAYYKAGNSKIKKLNGSVIEWWERSAYPGSIMSFALVDSQGYSNSSSAGDTRGVSFAFCF